MEVSEDVASLTTQTTHNDISATSNDSLTAKIDHHGSMVAASMFLYKEAVINHFGKATLWTVKQKKHSQSHN